MYRFLELGGSLVWRASPVLVFGAMLATACSTTAPEQGAQTSVGALGEQLNNGPSTLSGDLAMITGVALDTTLDGGFSSLGLFPPLDEGSGTLRHEWEIDVDTRDCSECGELNLVVSSQLFIDEVVKRPSTVIVGKTQISKGTTEGTKLSSAPVDLLLDPDTTHCVLAIHSFSITEGDRTIGHLDIETIFVVGNRSSPSSCRFAEQAAEDDSNWKPDQFDQEAFACGFIRFLNHKTEPVLLAEANMCSRPTLVVAIPTDEDGNAIDCCFHWFGTPGGEEGQTVLRDISTLGSGIWRPLRIVDPPGSDPGYLGPYETFNWPAVKFTSD